MIPSESSEKFKLGFVGVLVHPLTTFKSQGECFLQNSLSRLRRQLPQEGATQKSTVVQQPKQYAKQNGIRHCENSNIRTKAGAQYGSLLRELSAKLTEGVSRNRNNRNLHDD